MESWKEDHQEIDDHRVREKEEAKTNEAGISNSNGIRSSSQWWSLREAALSFRGEAEQGLDHHQEEAELKWAAIERIPTYDRLRTSLFQFRLQGDGEAEWEAVDVGQLGAVERRLFIESLIKNIEHDNSRLLHKQRQRIDRTPYLDTHLLARLWYQINSAAILFCYVLFFLLAQLVKTAAIASSTEGGLTRIKMAGALRIY